MALITSYHVPGLYVEDHSIDVPRLARPGAHAWPSAVPTRRGAMPAPIAGAPESIKLFLPRGLRARPQLTTTCRSSSFAGVSGGESPRPLSPTSDG